MMKKRSMLLWLGCIAALLLAVTLVIGYRTSVYGMVKAMPLRDKITQMLMMDLSYWNESQQAEEEKTPFTQMNDSVSKLLSEYRFGSVIYFKQNLTDTAQADHGCAERGNLQWRTSRDRLHGSGRRKCVPSFRRYCVARQYGPECYRKFRLCPADRHHYW